MNVRRNPQTGSRRREAAHDGWTLVEMLGVLTVIALLTAVLAPMLTQEIDRQTRLDEEDRLSKMGDALERSITRFRTVPGGTNWDFTLASYLGWHVEDVGFNGKGNERIYLIDPALRIGPTANSVLPYVQDWTGSRSPTSARLMIISSVGEELPTGLQSGVAASTNAFEEIWATAPELVPESWTWVGRGADLRIRRMQLDKMFVQVVLNSAGTNKGKFGVDGGVTNQLTTETFTTWFLKGTALRLHGSDGTLQSSEILHEPASYVYENGTWRGKAFMTLGTKRLTGQDLQEAVDLFLKSPWNSNAKDKVKQQDVVNALTSYMQEYISWAGSGFSYQSSKLKPIDDAQAIVEDRIDDLIFKP